MSLKDANAYTRLNNRISKLQDENGRFRSLLRAIVDCFNNSDTISDFSNAMVEHIETAEALLGGKPKQEEARMTTSIVPYMTSSLWGEKK